MRRRINIEKYAPFSLSHIGSVSLTDKNLAGTEYTLHDYQNRLCVSCEMCSWC